MPITVKLAGSERVIDTLRKIGGGALTTADVLRGIGDRGAKSVRRGIRDGKSPDGTPYPAVNRFGEGGQRLQDTKRLLNSITYEVGNGKVTIGTNVAYAAMQHFGGTQVPKTTKMLAIPLTRQAARAAAAAGGFRNAYPDAFVFKTANGALLLARRNTRGPSGGPASSGLDLLAILKSSVKIPATPFMGLSKEGEDDILAYLENVVNRIVEGQ